MVKLQPHSVTCARCGTQFKALRAEARYCSDACRMAAHAARHRPTPVSGEANASEVKRLTAEIERLRAQLAKATPVSAGANTSEAEIEKRIAAAVDAAAMQWVLVGKHVFGDLSATYAPKEVDTLMAAYRKSDRLRRLVDFMIGRETARGMEAALHKERAK